MGEKRSLKAIPRGHGIQTIVSFVVLTFLFSVVFSLHYKIRASASATYNVPAALDYAERYWNQNTNDTGIYYGGRGGDCCYFVSRCISHGGIPCNYINTGQFKNSPPEGFSMPQKVYCTTNGIPTGGVNAGKIAAGDILLYHYTLNGQDRWPHAVLVGDVSGNYVRVFSHTPNMGPGGYYDAKYYITGSHDMKQGTLDAYVLHFTGESETNVLGTTSVTEIGKTTATVRWEKGAFYPATAYGLRLGTSEYAMPMIFRDRTGQFQWAKLEIGAGRECDYELTPGTKYFAQFFSINGTTETVSPIFVFTTKEDVSIVKPAEEALKYMRVYSGDASESAVTITAEVKINRRPYEVGAVIATDWELSKNRIVMRDSNYPAFPADGNGKIWYDLSGLEPDRYYYYAFFSRETPQSQPIFQNSVCGFRTAAKTTYSITENENTKKKTVSIHRLYNPSTGEHFYTADKDECNYLRKNNWKYEDIAWEAPESSNTPVYRLCNLNTGDHHYTPSIEEKQVLSRYGWKDEGIAWYSDDNSTVPVYRLYNPYVSIGAHLYTTSEDEKNVLIKGVWYDEKIGFYGS